MNRFLTAICLLLFVFTSFSNAQNNSYWQQKVDYKINVKLDDVNHFLNGNIEINYKNNSPNDLSFIYFHIWPNAYSNNNTALAKQILKQKGPKHLFKVDSIRGFIDSLNFKVGKQILEWEYHPEHIDICKVYLENPLQSGESITISTPFRVKIPAGDISRLGQAENSYAITQWYPKPAVYDKNGWHEMPYLDMGEFYSEFGNFDVHITVPKNYVVAATGNLQNQEELEWLDSLSQVTSKVDSFPKKDPKIKSSKELKTLHYLEENIHDFGWFANKNFNVLKGEVTLPRTNKKVTTWAFFPNREGHLWKHACEYINDALFYYSEWNGDYPYNNCSAVHGPLGAGGGMEYPTITIIGNSYTAFSLEQVIMHEVGHNWFYGMLGFNERDFPYLDEGINSANEFRYIETKFPESKLATQTMGMGTNMARFLDIEDLPNYYMYSSAYLVNARRNYDQALNLCSPEYTYLNYGLVYFKPAVAFNYLKNYWGDENYDKTFQEFFEDWHYKHPSPENLNQTLKMHSESDLSWFTEDILTTTKKMDYKLVKINDDKVLVRNTGKIASPFPLQGIKKDSVLFEKWNEGFSGEKWISINNNNFDKLVIDKEQITLDLYKQNNSIRTNGLFPKLEPVKPKFLLGFDHYNKTEIYYAPAFGWNIYNNVMLGATFHNISIFKKRFEYQLTPLYGIGNKDLAGSGQLFFHFPLQSGIFRNIELKVEGKRYGARLGNNYNKIAGSLLFEYRESLINDNKYTIEVNTIHATDIEKLGLASIESEYNQFYQFIINKESINKNTPLNINLLTEIGPSYSKLQVDANFVKHYTKKKYAFNVDFFAGKFLSHDNDPYIYNFSLNGKSGMNDYLYEYPQLSRFHSQYSELWHAKQFINSEGGFSTLNYPTGISTDWLVALKLSHDLPFMLRPYLNIAALSEFFDYNDSPFFYEAGLRFGIKNIFEIYFPFTYTKDLEKYSINDVSKLSNRIRFVLNLKEINPQKLLKKIPY